MNKAIFEGMSKEQKVAILKEAHDTGEPIEKIVAKTDLPTMAILDADGKFDYEGNLITPDEWRKINPLGDYGKIVTINTQANINKRNN